MAEIWNQVILPLPKQQYLIGNGRGRGVPSSRPPSRDPYKLYSRCFSFICALLLACTFGCNSEPSVKSGRAASDEPQRVSSSAEEVLPPQAQELLIEGQKAFQIGEYERAMAFLDSAETVSPGAPVIPFNRGRIFTALNQVTAAQQAFQEAIDRDPYYPEVRLRLGDIELQAGNLEEALAYYREEATIEPAAQLFVNMGEVYYKLGKADSARIAYERALIADTMNASAHMMYGQLLEELGRVEEALVHSRKALALEPHMNNYQFAVGSQLSQLGQLEEAALHLKNAADGQLLHYPAQYTLSQTLTRLGREQEAQYYMARADSSRALMDQIANTQSIAARNPTSADGWIELGELFRHAGERDRAVQSFNRASAIDPENPRLMNNIGEMMLAEGDVRGAVKQFQSILRKDEHQPDVWKNLGLAFAVAGLCEDARMALDVALRYKPEDAAIKELQAGICAG